MTVYLDSDLQHAGYSAVKQFECATGYVSVGAVNCGQHRRKPMVLVSFAFADLDVIGGSKEHARWKDCHNDAAKAQFMRSMLFEALQRFGVLEHIMAEVAKRSERIGANRVRAKLRALTEEE